MPGRQEIGLKGVLKTRQIVPRCLGKYRVAKAPRQDCPVIIRALWHRSGRYSRSRAHRGAGRTLLRHAIGRYGSGRGQGRATGIGDQSRTWGPPFVGTESAYFLATNRNKRSIALDYDDATGMDILQRLLATADVFLCNQPSMESLQRRGLDPVTLRARHPRLIYCSITGYGFTGPKSGQPGYDILAQAEAGVMSFTGEPDGEPMRFPIAIADMTTGIYSAMGILGALYARERNRSRRLSGHGFVRFAIDMAGKRWQQLFEYRRLAQALGECTSEHCALPAVSGQRWPFFRGWSRHAAGVAKFG